MPDIRGLYNKFNLIRTEGFSQHDGRHGNCRYFVLDTHALKTAQKEQIRNRAAMGEKKPALLLNLSLVVKNA